MLSGVPIYSNLSLILLLLLSSVHWDPSCLQVRGNYGREGYLSFIQRKYLETLWRLRVFPSQNKVDLTLELATNTKDHSAIGVASCL